MTSTLNLPLESLQQELKTLEDVQRATLNILEDFDAEKQRLEEVQRATLNLLEDFGTERSRLEGVQRASLNILEDFDTEKIRLEGVQRATLNILEDFRAERIRLEGTERALLNILEDMEVEKTRVAELNQQLEAANKELEAFTYSVSHDLRAPLRHIDGFSKILLEEFRGKLEPAAMGHLQRIREGAQRMGHLVDDLLNLSRVGRRDPSLRWIGLDSLVKEVVTELAPETGTRKVEWQIGRLPSVPCDPALIKQVFANLLSNAIKFTRPREQAIIQVDQTTVEGQPVVFVRDNGVGFNMKYADKLFGVFQRLHSAQEFEGTGVGLATVQRIIHKHGGRIWAEAEPDKGATFFFTLWVPERSNRETQAAVGGTA